VLTNIQESNQLRNRAEYRARLPDVEASTAYGNPALRVHGKLLACVAAHRPAEPDSLVVLVDFDDHAELLAAAPDVYYVTEHYVGYSSVLVRLSRVILTCCGTCSAWPTSL
jgi:hypothetical protein